VSGAEITRRPAPRSALRAGGIAAVAPLAAVFGGAAAAALAAVGATALAVGVYLGRRDAVDGGALVAFAGVVLAGVNDAPALPVLLGTVATVLAWDVGGNALSLGAQLGREADTSRVESLHALAGAAVGVTAAVVGFALFAVGPTRQPVTTLFVLLLGATLLVVALNR